jgi:hypothetical protein
METRFLLPNKFKLIGWILLIPSSILGLFVIIEEFKFSFLEFRVFTISSGGFAPWEITKAFKFEKENLTATIVGIFILSGSIIGNASKRKERG